MSSGLSRRYFLMSGLAAAAVKLEARPSRPSLKRLGYKSPNEKLNIAAIGAGGKGASDIRGCSPTENIVALADVDWKQAAKTFDAFPKAKRYKNFREMLDKEKSIDAVTVSTPDHMHARAALACIERGLHVYVQKPLTRSIVEARVLREAARKYGVATQMGNQGHSNDGAREMCEIIWSGAIGPVTEVHAWTNRPIWPQGIKAPLPEEPKPDTIDWDLWLGPAAYRPYNSGYAPFKWRGWYDFGCGALGDMACHILDAPNWALQLSATGPTSIECIKIEDRNPYTFPTKSIVRFEFPARGAMPPVKLFWYEGGLKPPVPEGLPKDVKLGDVRDGRNGSLFIGETGFATTSTYGADTRLVPEAKMKDYKMPGQWLSRSPDHNHYRDWLRACKGGEAACSNFEYAAPFTEWVALGVIAQRFEGKLLWDSKAMKITNNAEANRLVRPPYRKGWKLA
jgi:predicted dehydrogenase